MIRCKGTPGCWDFSGNVFICLANSEQKMKQKPFQELLFDGGRNGVAFLHSNSLIKNISTAVLIFAIFIVVENAIGAMLVKGDLNYFEKVKYDTITLISIIKFATLGVSISIYSFFSKKINIELPSKYYFVL